MLTRVCVHVFGIPMWLGTADCCSLYYLVFPKDEIAHKQMQNLVMLKLFPNIIDHVGTNSCSQNKCCGRINCCNKRRAEWQKMQGGFQHKASSSSSILFMLCHLMRLLWFLQTPRKSMWSFMTLLVFLSVLFSSGFLLAPWLEFSLWLQCLFRTLVLLGVARFVVCGSSFSFAFHRLLWDLFCIHARAVRNSGLCSNCYPDPALPWVPTMLWLAFYAKRSLIPLICCCWLYD